MKHEIKHVEIFTGTSINEIYDNAQQWLNYRKSIIKNAEARSIGFVNDGPEMYMSMLINYSI